MIKASEDTRPEVSFTGELSGHVVLKGVIDLEEFWNLVVHTLTIGVVAAKLYPDALGGSSSKPRWQKIDNARIEHEAEDQLREGYYKLSDGDEEPDEASAVILEMIRYVESNLERFARDMVMHMMLEALYSACPSDDRDKKERINGRISRILDHHKQAIRKRLRSHYSLDSPLTKAKVCYAKRYQSFLDQWQVSGEIYENWLTEARRSNRGELSEGDLSSEEWKRRIRHQYPDANIPDDLLNRLVRDPRSPLFVDDINDYDRTPSHIAAVYTARHCQLPDDQSYETYMRIRREGDALIAVTKSEVVADSKLGE